MEHFDLDGHIEFVRKEYESRMRQMADLLREQQWPGVTLERAEGRHVLLARAAGVGRYS